MPYREPSRPRPDCLTPPNGATSVESMPVLMPTMLEAFFSALREGCTPTPGPERLGDPPPCHRRHQELAQKTAGESLRDHCGVALTAAFKVARQQGSRLKIQHIKHLKIMFLYSLDATSLNSNETRPILPCRRTPGVLFDHSSDSGSAAKSGIRRMSTSNTVENFTSCSVENVREARPSASPLQPGREPRFPVPLAPRARALTAGSGDLPRAGRDSGLPELPDRQPGPTPGLELF
jgi:hypothetical protein